MGASLWDKALARVRGLTVRPEVVGPHARLGMVWAVVTAAAAVAGPGWLAAWLAPVAALAAAQAARSWRREPRRPTLGVVGLGSGALVVAAAGGWVAAAVTAVVCVGLAFAQTQSRAGRRADALLASAIILVIGLSGAAPVLLRHEGTAPALALLALAAAYDVGAYVVGTGATGIWEGPAAGTACIGSVTLAVAAAFSPPFSGASPWLLGALAAALAPLGPLVGTALMKDRTAPAPALRRLDSLFVLGPLWGVAALAALRLW